MGNYSLSGAAVITPKGCLASSSVEISGTRIGAVNGISDFDVPLENATIAPALINAHDHLLGTYWPKVGRGPYPTWREWDIDLKASPLYNERSKIANEDLYLLGALRNLISGVLTVSDHVPHELNDPFIPKMPIRVIKDYALAHEVSKYDLKWGKGVAAEHELAVKNGIPFITHIEEGFDEESKRGVEYLIRDNALSEHTVLIHGIALSAADIKAIALAKAHMVWCPVSNTFMFDKTGDIRAWRRALINISIGTDSPMSGGRNILEEMRFARDYYTRQCAGDKLPDREIFDMVTKNPAKALRLSGLGVLEKNATADIIVVNGSGGYRSVIAAGLRDIRLVIRAGVPVYGDESFIPLFEHEGTAFHRVTVEGAKKVSAYDINRLMARIRTAVGFSKELPFLPVE